MLSQKINWKAVEEYLTIGTTMNNATFKEGVDFKLTSAMKYNNTNFKSSVDAVLQAFENTILTQCRGKKNILLELSGGKDSRLIAAILKKYNIDFSAVVYGDGKCLDVRVAKLVARSLKVPLDSFTNAKEGFTMEAAREIIKRNHGLRFFHNRINQYHYRDYLKQFDLVINGYTANYLFDSHCCFQYPKYPWFYILESHNAFIPSCVNSKRVYIEYATENYDLSLEELWVNEINSGVTIDYDVTDSLGINEAPVFDQYLIDTTFELPYSQRVGISLTQQMMSKVNKTMWLLPYSSYGGFPLAVPYSKHMWLYARLPKNLPNWRFVDPSESMRNIKELFSDYIETLPAFVSTLSELGILKKDKALGLLKSSVLFEHRLMNFKIWCDVNEKIY